MASYDGFVNGDTPLSLATLPVLSTTATSSSPPGDYPITASGAADPNYNITYVAGLLHVAAASSPLMQVWTIATDLAGNPITSITVGQQFKIETIVQDVRDPVAQFPGVFSAAADVTFNSAISSIDTGQTVTFGSIFDLLDSASLSQGEVIGYGATSSLTAPGNDPQLLFSVVAMATGVGTQSFSPAFDLTVGHDSQLFGLDTPLTPDEITFVGGTLEILNAPPVAQDDSATTYSTQPVAIPVLDNDSDLFGALDPTTVSVVGIAGHGTTSVDPTTGVITYTPSAGYVGADSFTYTVRDNLGAISNVATVGINVLALAELSVGDASVAEGNSGTTPLVFTVSLSAASGQQVTVGYATSDGTATAGSDYQATSGTLTFAPGVTSQLVTVQVSGDTLDEPDERLSLTLSSPTNATLGTATGTGTILDDDATPTLSISSASVAEGNSGTTPLVVHGQPVGSQWPAGHRRIRHQRRIRHGRQRLPGHQRDADFCSRSDKPTGHGVGRRRHHGGSGRGIYNQPQRTHEGDHRHGYGCRHDPQR